MAIAGRGCARLAVKRRDPHALHQAPHVQTPDLKAFSFQKLLQHARARERVIEMKFVDAAHQYQVSRGRRLRQVVDDAAADPQSTGLAGDGQFVTTIDHFLALPNSPALVSAPDKKSFSSESSPIFACSVFTSTAGSEGFDPLSKIPASPSRA
ncbi:hypothetical protein ACVWY5_000252 [Bradyrhizobium sp. USDA 3256]